MWNDEGLIGALHACNKKTRGYLNIPDEFLSAVRRYGNHFLDSLLCILNHNFIRIFVKAATHRRCGMALTNILIEIENIVKHKKVISGYQNPDFQIYGLAISNRKNIQLLSG